MVEWGGKAVMGLEEEAGADLVGHVKGGDASWDADSFCKSGGKDETG
jgi:hypothetical protein